MMKQIRQRFIRIALLALTMAMLLVACSINFVHLVSANNELNTTLGYLVENENMISQDKQKKGGFQNGEDESRSDNNMTADSISENGQPFKQKGHNHMQNTLEESRYFIVILRTDGELFLGAGSKETDLSEDEQLTLAEEVFASENLAGNIGNYRYQITDKPDGARVAIFLNCESKYAEVATLAVISLFSLCLHRGYSAGVVGGFSAEQPGHQADGRKHRASEAIHHGRGA